MSRQSNMLQDFLIILDTCGAGKAIGPAPKLLGNNSEHASWDVEEMLVLPGGSYKLCWCSAFAEPSGSCVSAEDFLIEVGDLQVLGPALVPQDRTCVSGLTCLFSLYMYGTLAADSLALMDTCGVSLDNLLETFSPSVSVTSFPGNGFNAWSAEVKIGSWAAPGGSYRLCWCGRSDCQRLSEFTVDLGRLDLVGLYPLQQDRTCISGEACMLADLSGHLVSKSIVLVLDTCALDRATLLRSSDEASISAASGAFVSWTMLPSAPGGTYRLCWCSEWQGGCSVENALVDVGQLTLLGPAPLYQHRTCISGLSCELAGFTGTLNGYLWVLDTCGTLAFGGGFDERQSLQSMSLSNSEPSALYSLATAAGGEYRLCWCSSPVANANFTSNASNISWSCQFATDFGTDFGRLSLVGVSPLHQDQTCVSGQHCHLRDLRGNMLSSLDRVAVQDTCGQSTLPPTWPLGSLSEEGTGQLSITWTSITLPGGQYRLCWCHGGTFEWDANISSQPELIAPYRCSTAESFRVDFGSLTLLGPPLLQDRTCVSGETCRLTLEGALPGDLVQILDTCGVGHVPYGLPNGGRLETEANATNVSNEVYSLYSGKATNKASITFSFGQDLVSTFGATYRLCWCSVTADCLNLESFRVDVGQFTVLGASFLREFTCLSGRHCEVDVPT